MDILKPNNISVNVAEAKEKGWLWISRFLDGKMKGIWSLNTNTLTCSWCIAQRKKDPDKYICPNCYSARMMKGVRQNCIPAFQYNSDLLSADLVPWGDLPVICRDIFRFSAHGEVDSVNHFINFCNVAKKNIDVTFGWWTKRVDLVNKYHHLIPDNVILIYSNPEVNALGVSVPKHFSKIFNVYTKDFAKDKGIKVNCKGAKEGGCITCRRCYSFNNIQCINEVIK